MRGAHRGQEVKGPSGLDSNPVSLDCKPNDLNN